MSWEYLLGGATVIGALYTVLAYYKKTENTPSNSSNNTRLLSLGIEHSYPIYNISYIDRQKIQISICNTGAKKCSIKQIDWAIAGTPKRSSVKVSFDFPFLVPDAGVLIELPVKEILIPQFNFEDQSNYAKLEILKNLELEVVLMTHNEHFNLPVPRSLKLALFRFHSTKKCFSWVYELWLY